MREIDETDLHKVGKYGSKETDKDERFSREIVEDIYYDLKVNYPINGFDYYYWEHIDESSYYKMLDQSIDTSSLTSSIVPDSGSIILRSNEDINTWYLVLSAEDKNQSSSGNAIERFAKNYNVMDGKICHNSEILPYVLFCSGEGLCTEERTLRNHIESKFRQILPCFKNGRPYIWSVEQKHTMYKNGWNLVYTKDKRFSYEEKREILYKVAKDVVEYYKVRLKK